MIVMIAFGANGFNAAANDSNIQLPSLGDQLSSVVSEYEERRLGAQWLRELRGQVNIIDDPFLNDYLRTLINRLIPFSDLDNMPIELVIVDSPNLNAFAVPGGIIGINLGLLLYSDSEDELMSVLAHEIAHLSQRHYARQVEQAGKRDPVTLAAVLASVLLIASDNADAGFAGLVSSQAASIQDQLGFSRDFEREADRLGMSLLANAGYNAGAMTNMFGNMQEAARFRVRPLEFLLTHPLTESRIADAAGRAELYIAKQERRDFAFVLSKLKATVRYQWSPKEYIELLSRWSRNDNTQFSNGSVLNNQENYSTITPYAINDSSPLSWLSQNNTEHQLAANIVLMDLMASEEDHRGMLQQLNYVPDEYWQNSQALLQIRTVVNQLEQTATIDMTTLNTDAINTTTIDENHKRQIIERYTRTLSKRDLEWRSTLYSSRLPNQHSLLQTDALLMVSYFKDKQKLDSALETCKVMTQEQPSSPFWWEQLAVVAKMTGNVPLQERAYAETLFHRGDLIGALRQMEQAISSARSEKRYSEAEGFKTRLQQMAITAPKQGR